ncbi:MAG: AraC family transcriptional regulator [Gammaproteobacteria bacterium]|nr:AraC family transcriptional regulator [Gammaproteobacteria bacterium]
MQLSVSSLMISKALSIAAEHDVYAAELCNLTGISMSLVRDPDERLPYSAYLGILAEVVRRTGNEYFWLQESGAELYAHDNPMWYVIFGASTLQQALTRAERFYTFYSDVHYPSCHINGDFFSIRRSLHAPGYPFTGHALDWAFASWFSIARIFAGTSLKLCAINLDGVYKYRRPSYENFFKVPVYVDAKHNELVFHRRDLDLPNRHQHIDPHLENILLGLVSSHKPTVTGVSEWKKDLRIVLQCYLLYGAPDLKTIAMLLGMSPRTLQRKLAGIGSSFYEQVHEVRSTLASTYLKQDDLSVAEVARRIGFEDGRSLSVAFQKWYGMSPTEYRDQLKKTGA